MALTPQIDNAISSDLKQTTIQLPSYTYKLNVSNSPNYPDRIVGFVDGLEATKQAIYHILSIERYAYLIYDRNYGVELNQYIGADLEYIKATIQDTLKEALTHDLRILSIDVTNIEKISTDSVLINFTAYTIYGNLIMEVSINV